MSSCCRFISGFRFAAGPWGIGDDPAFEQTDLPGRQLFSGFRWHAFAGFCTANQLQEMAEFRFARDDGRFSGITTPEQAGTAVQSETTFLRLRAVAVEAVFGKEWLDVAGVVDIGIFSCGVFSCGSPGLCSGSGTSGVEQTGAGAEQQQSEEGQAGEIVHGSQPGRW